MDGIVIYNTEDGRAQVRFQTSNGTVWLTQAQIGELFDVQKAAVSKHIKNILLEGELDMDSVVSNLETTAADGKNYNVAYYSLEMILAIGFRVRSSRGVQFRRWANTVLQEYLIKGFSMDDERLKALGGGDYFKELLDRIRDIRSSERVLYRQVLDLFATSADYDGKAITAKKFFKIVQNKFHFAAHGHTAAEIIYERADATQPFMGLTAFEGEYPRKKDIEVAKNYLTEHELKDLNNLVSGYFDFAEYSARNKKILYMKDYLTQLDMLMGTMGAKVLTGAGKISHEKAIEKAREEYSKYQEILVTPVETAFLENIKVLESNVKHKK